MLVPLVGMAAPFAFLPLLSRFGGVEVWAAVGVGHSVGHIAATAAGRGWSLTGPAWVVRSRGAKQLYERALASRVKALLIVVPLAALVSILVTPAAPAMAASVACGSALAGLRSDWYFIGQGRPGPILFAETLPRVGALLMGAAIYWAHPEWWWIYPSSLAAGALLATVLAATYVRRVGRDAVGDWPSPPISAVAADVTATLYSTGSVAVVGASSSIDQVALYSSGDRLYKLSLFVITAVSQALQSWVLEGTSLEQRSKLRQAFLIHAGLGTVGMVTAALTGPLLTGLLFGNQFRIDYLTAALFGLAFAAVSMNTAVTRYLLAPAGRTRAVFWATGVTSLIGVPLTAVLAHTWGAAGGAAGLAVSQILVCLLQVPSARLSFPTVREADPF